MSVITTEVPRTAPTPVRDGGLARLGRWSATHLRAVLLLWLLVIAGLGAFAPRIESALSGAGWQDSTSQSVQGSSGHRPRLQGSGRYRTSSRGA
jgi:hypothetical protein